MRPTRDRINWKHLQENSSKWQESGCWVEAGLDALNPLEVKAGMDPVHLKSTFGNELLLHGGIDAVLWDYPDHIRCEMERVVPVLKQNGDNILIRSFRTIECES